MKGHNLYQCDECGAWLIGVHEKSEHTKQTGHKFIHSAQTRLTTEKHKSYYRGKKAK